MNFYFNFAKYYNHSQYYYIIMEEAIYYLHVDGQQKGPFQLSQLIQEGMTAETMIWRTGLPSWVTARTLPEVAVLFEVAEPVYQEPEPQQPQPEPIQQPQPPYTQPANHYQQQPAAHYQQPVYQAPLPQGWFNWSTIALVAMIVGFVFGIVGGVFGLIGLLKAGEANEAARTNNPMAKDLNKSAMIWTLISATIAVYVTLFMFSSLVLSFYSGLFGIGWLW